MVYLPLRFPRGPPLRFSPYDSPLTIPARSAWGPLDYSQENRRQKEFNNRRARFRRQGDRRSVEWLCRRDGTKEPELAIPNTIGGDTAGDDFVQPLSCSLPTSRASVPVQRWKPSPVTTICAPPTVWEMFVQEDMKGLDPDGSTGSVRSLSRCRQIR